MQWEKRNNGWKWMEMDEVDAIFNKCRSPGGVQGFTVTACLSPFVSHQGHMEMFN